jgi:4-aminobutyrate aminotransferase/(S)-3-amino-2-methylpropionate transaminase
MTPPPFPAEHAGERESNRARQLSARVEPRSLRTFSPSQAVIARSAGSCHWTADGKKLWDFTSGVLVSNLGHNPTSWMRRFSRHMGWGAEALSVASDNVATPGYFPALPMTTYNAVTDVEAAASDELVKLLFSQAGGERMEQVLWAASGSEAIQKALWAAMARDRSRPIMLATRHGFHGKKGLSNAVTGSETDAERDPRVRFISFPMAECRDVSMRNEPFDPSPYRKELDALHHQFGRKIGTLITEPYLGGGGSYHPPKAYLQTLQAWCREHDVVFILDEVQSNFGRTGKLFAFTTYGLEPDIVVLGKGLGNGVPVAAAVGRADIFAALDYGEASDTWSANPLMCAAVLATLEEFQASDVMAELPAVSRRIEAGLCELKRFSFMAAVRGEFEGMVWGIEFADHGGRTANERANQFVLEAYRGDGPTADGVHLLGPLAKKVVRVAPPLTLTAAEADAAVKLLHAAAARM